MYGADRVKTPLLRMKDGKFHKEGDFTPVSWDQAFTIMAEKIKDILKKKNQMLLGCSLPVKLLSMKAMQK